VKAFYFVVAEVNKALKARKIEKIKKTQSEMIKKQRQELLQNSTSTRVDEQRTEAGQGSSLIGSHTTTTTTTTTTDQVAKRIHGSYVN